MSLESHDVVLNKVFAVLQEHKHDINLGEGFNIALMIIKSGLRSLVEGGETTSDITLDLIARLINIDSQLEEYARAVAELAKQTAEPTK